ncbi:hypothetical protein D9M70_527820 [compost metagenome]
MHHAADLAPFGEVQGQAALEQDQRHRQGNQREQQRAEQRLRVQQAGCRAGDDARQQQEEDRRQAQAPGQPLAEQRRRADAAQAEQDMVFAHLDSFQG